MDEVIPLKHRFLAGHGGSVDLVSPSVLRSWIRCHEQCLSPDMPVQASLLPRADIAAARERSRRLVGDAAAETAVLARLIGGSSSMVILADDQGVIVETLGDPDIVTRTQRVALRPGGDWGETAKGTNAIGTALRERRPVEVHAGEHFFDALSFLTCVCAPIFDPFGNLIGALDVTTHRDGRHPHTAGLVALTAELIEQHMFRGRFPRDMVVEFSATAGAIGVPGTAIMVVREDGVVVAMNRHAFAALDVLPHQLGQLHLGEVVGTRMDALRAHVMAGEGTPVRLDGPGGRMFHARATASPARLRAAGSEKPARRPATDRLRPTLDDLDHGDPVLRRGIARLRKVIGRDIAILIEGETGTGKELMARAIHADSQRCAGPFVAINCAAIPEQLIESELFGHVPGAFTGAARQGSPGRIRQADGGTLFLDEIGEMPAHLQTRLLRVIEERVVLPVGGTKEIPVDIALISATNRDVFADGSERLRLDLLHRLAGFRLALPALRDRVDIGSLIMRILEAEALPGHSLTVDEPALAALRAYHWPGNIRELRNTLRTAAALAGEAGVVSPDTLPAHVMAAPLAAAATSLEGAKAQAARRALDRAGGNHSAAARELGISRTTLYRYVRSSQG